MVDLKERGSNMIMWHEVYSCNYNKNINCKKNNCKYSFCKGDCKNTTEWKYARRTPLNYIKHHITQNKESKYDITKIINKIDITSVTENNILFFQVNASLSPKDMEVLTKGLEEQTKCKCILLPKGIELNSNIKITHKETEE